MGSRETAARYVYLDSIEPVLTRQSIRLFDWCQSPETQITDIYHN
jgi:hypothetical protein